jgi:hypothetical protein
LQGEGLRHGIEEAVPVLLCVVELRGVLAAHFPKKNQFPKKPRAISVARSRGS